MNRHIARGARWKVTVSALAILQIALVRPLAGSRSIQDTAPAAGKVCRAYSTDETRKSSTGTLQVKCKYDTATNQHICQENYSGASSYSYVQTTQFASVADFVGDPSRVTFFVHAKGITIKFPASSSTQTYTYDGRGYLASIATSSSTGGGTVQKVTAWDSFGRPTEGRDETQDFLYTYDDAKRVVTQRSSGLPTLITVTLDQNANQVSSTTTSPTFKDATTITVHTTEQVCR